MTDFAQLSGINDLFFGFDQVRRAFALRADLAFAIVLSGCSQYRFSFDHIDRNRLLQIDMSTGFQSFDSL